MRKKEGKLVSFKLRDDVLARLEAKAKEEKTTKTLIVENALDKYLKKKED